jgi:hypothetical protein
MTATSSKKIIGGMFGLESFQPPGDPTAVQSPRFLSGRQIKLATGRSAFRLLESFLAPKTVWMPSYLCGVVLGAFRTARIRFYPIDEHLCVAADNWLTEVAPGDFVVFIDYFGFNLWPDWGAEARRRGAWIVEDACQAMLNAEFCQHAHYVIFSPRKFVGVPDGGILLAQGESSLPEPQLPPPPAGWWLEAFEASRLRGEFDRHGGDRRWFDLFRKIDPSGPIEPARMSELTSLLLLHAINFTEVARRRRENYLVVAGALARFAMFPTLPETVVPLGFPVRLSDREVVRQALFAHEIYPPVHWSIQDVVPETFHASHRLADDIMTIPCDQRYGRAEMQQVADLVRGAGSR